MHAHCVRGVVIFWGSEFTNVLFLLSYYQLILKSSNGLAWFVLSAVKAEGDKMAENEQSGGNNLDDFFAKKDKSKKKTKSSKFTVDDILQAKAENEEKSKKARSKKKEKDATRTDKMLGVKTGVIFGFKFIM